MTRDIIYNASPTLADFHSSNAFVRGIRGPVGAGKSTGCCMEIMRRAQEQAHSPIDGIRYTRFAIVRNTYGELRDTTVKTWLDWFPEDIFGKFNYQTMTHHIRMNDFDLEVMFRALDRPDDAKKVLSLELTGAWVNEAREVPRSIVFALSDRVGRYPSVRNGGTTWSGILMDTNSPDTDHWWYRYAEHDPLPDEVTPENWKFFAQPGGVIEQQGKWIDNPKAENIKNLEANYYVTRIGGKTRDHILVYYANAYGFVKEGKPVYPEYVDSAHAADMELEPVKILPIYVGLDFGLTPAAVFGQRLANGRWLVIDELVAEDMGTVRFAEELNTKINRDYAGYTLHIFGDPAGDQRAQTDERTPFDILKEAKIKAFPTDTNDVVIRREAVATSLTRMLDGKPGFLISPKCKISRKGMAGGYSYKRVQVPGDERFHDKPDKNRYSHPCDAMQYMMLGAGEGKKVVGQGMGWTALPKVKRAERV